ncbi:MAG: hypothetical protein WCT05_09975, partial [Lentisphaeria bacterium]
IKNIEEIQQNQIFMTVNCSGTIHCPGLLYGVISGTIIWRLTASLRLRRKAVPKNSFVKKLVKRLPCYGFLLRAMIVWLCRLSHHIVAAPL